MRNSLSAGYGPLQVLREIGLAVRQAAAASAAKKLRPLLSDLDHHDVALLAERACAVIPDHRMRDPNQLSGGPASSSLTRRSTPTRLILPVKRLPGMRCAAAAGLASISRSARQSMLGERLPSAEQILNTARAPASIAALAS
jgi:hypothetical protein